MTNLCPEARSQGRDAAGLGGPWSPTAFARTPSSSSLRCLLDSHQRKLGSGALVEKLLGFGEEDWTRNAPKALKAQLQPETIE